MICPHCHKAIEQKDILYEDSYIEIDPSQFKVRINGKRIRLTATEHRVLGCLVENAGRILTHRRILEIVWGFEYIDDVDYVRLYIWRLRQKLEPDPEHPVYILCQPGIGYYFNNEQQAEGVDNAMPPVQMYYV